MTRRAIAVVVCLAACSGRLVAGAEDAGWVTLFNGTSLDGNPITASTGAKKPEGFHACFTAGVTCSFDMVANGIGGFLKPRRSYLVGARD
ncbi:MAG: cysteine desulfurase [Planctomycetia bacterium]|nr:cysteine desulfurase [Planctomycetia bacterium]